MATQRAKEDHNATRCVSKCETMSPFPSLIWLPIDTKRKEPGSDGSDTVVHERLCVGLLAVSLLKDRRNDHYLFIEELFVDPTCRRKRIALALMETVAAHVYKTELNYASLIVRSNAVQQKAARALYSKIGFKAAAVPQLFEADVDVHLNPNEYETYLQVDFEVLRSRSMQVASERPLDENFVVDREPMKAADFIKAQPRIIIMGKSQHSKIDGGDGGNMEELLMTANYGVFGVYDSAD